MAPPLFTVAQLDGVYEGPWCYSMLECKQCTQSDLCVKQRSNVKIKGEGKLTKGGREREREISRYG